jgi:hypothetical protein
MQEITPGKSFCDAVNYFDPRGVYYRFGLGLGWACVVGTGGSSCTVDATWR